MPLIRYELRSEFKLANPELYRTVPKSDAEALFESISMAALAGIVRQLGEVAELAAEIFNDLHQEVMTFAARGHKLRTRVQQLESVLPAYEKSVIAERDQLRFAFAPGLEWHPNVCADQNQCTQELPPFIQKAYNRSRGPPRFYLVDSFDIAGPGASLKRYTDPSFFRVEWANAQITKAEKAHARKASKGKKERKHEGRNDLPPASSTINNVSSLDASKFIHSVATLTAHSDKDSIAPLTISESNTGQSSLETLKISAREIEAGSLLRKSSRASASDSDQVTTMGSPDQFVDALTSVEPETEPDFGRPGVSDIDESTPTSSGSNQVCPQIEVTGSAAASATVEASTDGAGIVHKFQGATELSFYSSTSPSEISSPSLGQHSPSLLSELSEESYSQPVFSVFDSPISIVGTAKSGDLCTMHFSPGSPTLDPDPLATLPEVVPSPPPLPPSKWRTPKLSMASPVEGAAGPPPAEVAKEGGAVVESQQHDVLMDSIVSHDKGKLRKVGSHTRAKSLDSRDVLLEQIRSRSFNLKHAVQEKNDEKSESPCPVANCNVAAIIEKATAIRQALESSDDEEEFS